MGVACVACVHRRLKYSFMILKKRAQIYAKNVLWLTFAENGHWSASMHEGQCGEMVRFSAKTSYSIYLRKM